MTLETCIALVVAGLLLLFCEIFVPGGVLGLIGIALIAVGVISGFTIDISVGFWLFLGSTIAGMTGFYLWVKYFPDSRIGKKVFLSDDGHEWTGFDEHNAELLGREGVAHTPLRPSGTAIIDGARVDVVTRGELVDAQSKIRVIEVEGNRVVVTTC